MSRPIQEPRLAKSTPLTELVPDLYREIFIHAKDAITIIDSEGHYLDQNASHRALMGYRDDELFGQTPAIHLGEEVFASIVRELLDKGEYRGEVTSRTRDGELREIELCAFAMKDAN